MQIWLSIERKRKTPPIRKHLNNHHLIEFSIILPRKHLEQKTTTKWANPAIPSSNHQQNVHHLASRHEAPGRAEINMEAEKTQQNSAEFQISPL
jgi:hypothetical protein